MKGGKFTYSYNLLPTTEQTKILRETCREYTSLVNDIVDYALGQDYMPRLSSASVKAEFPSALSGPMQAGRQKCISEMRQNWDSSYPEEARVHLEQPKLQAHGERRRGPGLAGRTVTPNLHQGHHPS